MARKKGKTVSASAGIASAKLYVSAYVIISDFLKVKMILAVLMR